jgi:hypothetical protein
VIYVSRQRIGKNVLKQMAWAKKRKQRPGIAEIVDYRHMLSNPGKGDFRENKKNQRLSSKA